MNEHNNTKKSWSNEHVEDDKKQYVKLNDNERMMKLDNAIALLSAIQNELKDDSYPVEKLSDGLSQIHHDLNCVKNGYMVI